MIDPDIIYAQIAVVRNHALPRSLPYHNMFEIVLVAQHIAVMYGFPCTLDDDRVVLLMEYVLSRRPSVDYYLSFADDIPDLEFGYGPSVYNALMLLTPSNRFYGLLCSEEII